MSQHFCNQLNGSGQQSRKCHFNWKFQVCQNPPKLCKPTCVMWKDVAVLFSPKTAEKRLEKQAQTSTPTPLPPPSMPENDVKRILAGFCRVAQGFHISCIQIQHFSGGKEQLEGGGGGVKGWGRWGERTLDLFVKSFLPAFRETTQEHLFKSHGSACEVWVDSDKLEKF